MDLKHALEFIANLGVKAEAPEMIEINGRQYCTKDLRRYDKPDKAEPIKATTLTALVDYIKKCPHELREHMIVHVKSPTMVQLYSGLMEERDREHLFEVNAMLPRFRYGEEYGQEAFIIAMQACFEHNDDRDAVTFLASNIVNAEKTTYSDNGISQQAVIKTGITVKEKAMVPNPVKLIPYRTFLEVEQPESEFVLRLNENRDGAPLFKLVEADGGRWQADAMDSVYSYLENELAGIPGRENIVILA